MACNGNSVNYIIFIYEVHILHCDCNDGMYLYMATYTSQGQCQHFFNCVYKAHNTNFSYILIGGAFTFGTLIA